MQAFNNRSNLEEFSVVFTNRSLNHMSREFQDVMKNLSINLKDFYNADYLAIIPGGGTYAMESVARQITQNKHCLTLRNGFFNYRWTQIFEYGGFIEKETTIIADSIEENGYTKYLPANINKVVDKIKKVKPDIIFATHVETSSGIILNDEYIKTIAKAIHEINGILVLDCVASGIYFPNMKKLGIDILITAPQKGLSSTPCAGLVMLNEKAFNLVEQTKSNSFAMDLKKWLDIMKAYEDGGHAYHATMPTDSLVTLNNNINEIKSIGINILEKKQKELGEKIIDILNNRNIESVTNRKNQSFSVIVCYTDKDNIQNGRLFLENNMQIASGVPLKCNEDNNFKSFRLGLFGIDKLMNIDYTTSLFEKTINKIF